MIAAMQSARVAVVVPVLDELRQLPALAAELGRLRDAGAEIVVVDGGSRDGTRAALDALDLEVIGAPRGRATQMNAGARATTAPVLLFLHADTRLPDGALDTVAAAIDDGAAGGCFRVRIESRDPRLAVAARIINLRSRLLPSASGDQAIFADRAAFDRIGGYRELALCEDLDFVARLSRQGRFVCLDGEVTTSARRWQAHGVSRTIALMWALRLGYHLGVSPRLLARWYADAR
jgi:rSAM/selenodomain-associated transferase 2